MSDKKKKRQYASREARIAQQKLWSWYDFYTRLGTPNKVGAAKVKEQLAALEEANPLLPKSNLR